MARQTICTNCTRLFKRGLVHHTNVKTGSVITDRELICVWKGQSMNNISAAICSSFKARLKPEYNERNLVPSNLEGKSINV